MRCLSRSILPNPCTRKVCLSYHTHIIMMANGACGQTTRYFAAVPMSSSRILVGKAAQLLAAGPDQMHR